MAHGHIVGRDTGGASKARERGNGANVEQKRPSKWAVLMGPTRVAFNGWGPRRRSQPTQQNLDMAPSRGAKLESGTAGFMGL